MQKRRMVTRTGRTLRRLHNRATQRPEFRLTSTFTLIFRFNEMLLLGM